MIDDDMKSLSGGEPSQLINLLQKPIVLLLKCSNVERGISLGIQIQIIDKSFQCFRIVTRLDVILVKRFVGVRHCLSEPDKEAEGANGLALLHQNQEPGLKFTAKEQYIPSFSLSVSPHSMEGGVHPNQLPQKT